jgi:hypothetical protein
MVGGVEEESLDRLRLGLGVAFGGMVMVEK